MKKAKRNESRVDTNSKHHYETELFVKSIPTIRLEDYRPACATAAVNYGQYILFGRSEGHSNGSSRNNNNKNNRNNNSKNNNKKNLATLNRISNASSAKIIFHNIYRKRGVTGTPQVTYWWSTTRVEIFSS